MADKKYAFTIVLAITISIIIGGAAGFIVCKNLPTTTNKVANDTEIINANGVVNLSDIGNVTNVKQLKNGTYQFTVSASKEAKYKNNVMEAIKADAKSFSNVCTVQITTKDDNESRVVYEKPNSIACKFVETKPPIPPVPPTCDRNYIFNESEKICVPTPVPPVVNNTPPVPPTPPKPTCTNEQVYNATTNKCDPKPVPPTPPTPPVTVSNETIKVVMVGDIESSSDGTAVFNAIKKQNPNNIVVLGDLGYASSLSWFKQTYGSLGNKINCVIGNHEAANEDGSTSLQAEATKYCSNSYYFKKNHVLFLGFNTNGNLNTQLGDAQSLVMNKEFMNGIKSVHVMTHKPCSTPPNSHHPVETGVKTFCDSLKAKVPTGVKVYFDSGHNHVMSASADGTYKQAGSGGKSHYTCGVSPSFPFCDNSHYGFLEYTIKPDATTTAQFIDYNGKVLYSK